MKELEAVTLMRVKRNSMGALPNGFWEGALVGVTDLEVTALKKNPLLLECFEEVTIKTRSTDASRTSETPEAESDQSSLSTVEHAVDRKT